MMRTHQWELSDALRLRVKLLVPPRQPRPKGGQPPEDDRLEKVKQ